MSTHFMTLAAAAALAVLGACASSEPGTTVTPGADDSGDAGVMPTYSQPTQALPEIRYYMVADT